jgi:hypothetical protein
MLKIRIEYNYKEDTFKVWSQVKTEHIEDMLLEFLRSQMGLGKDDSEPAVKDVYTMEITINLENDVFTINSDTGNASLSAGIVNHLAGLINNESDKVEIVEDPVLAIRKQYHNK